MGDTIEAGENSASENEVGAKSKRSENEAVQLVSWAVRRSPSREGKIELRVEGPSGEPVIFWLDPLVAYDLSDRLLEESAAVKVRT